MLPGSYEQVPLTADEKDLLYTIYDQRRRFLLIVYIVLIAAAIAVYFRGIRVGRVRVSYEVYNAGSGIPAWVAGGGCLSCYWYAVAYFSFLQEYSHSVRI